MELTYYVEKRSNVHAKNKVEYALNIFKGRTYNLICFKNKPSQEEIEEALFVFKRSISIYKAILVGFFEFPNIELTEEKE